MIPKICNVCGMQRLEKPASLYWAWMDAGNTRRAFLQRVCSDCFMEQYAADILRADEPVLLCPRCGESVADYYETVWLTYCLPGMPKASAEMPYCGVHGPELRHTAQLNATSLQDRGVVVGGLGPQPSNPNDVWARLGTKPRQDVP